MPRPTMLPVISTSLIDLESLSGLVKNQAPVFALMPQSPFRTLNCDDPLADDSTFEEKYEPMAGQSLSDAIDPHYCSLRDRLAGPGLHVAAGLPVYRDLAAVQGNWIRLSAKRRAAGGADFKVSLSFPWHAQLHDGAVFQPVVPRDTIGPWY